jgi:hypothetical protein
MAAVKHGLTREIDVAQLRERLSELGILPTQDLAEPEVIGSVEERVARLAGGDESALFDVVLVPKDIALPILESVFRKSETDRSCIARALAWFKSDTGLEQLIEDLRVLIKEETEPYDDTHPHAAGNPKAGIIDEIDNYWRINQLMTLLGILGDEEAVDVICKVVDRASAGGHPRREATAYIKSRIDMQRVPHFDRLLCIAFALERLANPRFIPSVESLLDKPNVRGYLSVTNEDAGLNYHGAYAEVSLAAAAARCGSVKGAQRLAEFLDDVHEILSTFAYRELREMTGTEPCPCEGRDGRSSAVWLEWLADREELPSVTCSAPEYIF